MSSCQYVKMNKIKKGTYGTVYKARNIINNEIVAMKKISSAKLAKHEANFLKMASKHSGVVDYKGMVRSNSAYFIIQEYVARDLHSCIHQLTMPQIKSIHEQLKSVVDYIHSLGFLHRDITPSNILITEDFTVKLADFGTAIRFEDIHADLPAMTTLQYRSPWIMLGGVENTRSDFWSVGCILLQLILQKLPFRGVSEIDYVCNVLSVIGLASLSNAPLISMINADNCPFEKQKFIMQVKDNLPCEDLQYFENELNQLIFDSW